MNLIFSTIFGVLYFFVSIQAYITCGGEEECVPLRDCERVRNKLEELSSENKRLVLNYIRENKLCGFEGAESKICCNKIIVNKNLTQCGVINTNESNQNGIENPINYPWVALLEYKVELGTKYRCGGVLISHRYVLTTATCLKLQPIMVHLNILDVNETKTNTFKVPVKSTITYENSVTFDLPEEYSYDIGLIELDQSVSILPICLPEQQSKSIQRYVAAAIGTRPVYKKLENKRKKVVTLQPLDNDICRKDLTLFAKNDTICAKTIQPSNECYADVGGGLSIYENGIIKLAGIYSAPWLCRKDQANPPLVFTDVSYYLNWIKEHIK